MRLGEAIMGLAKGKMPEESSRWQGLWMLCVSRLGEAGFPVGLSHHSLQCHFPEGKSQLLELEIFTALSVPRGRWSIYKYTESQRSKTKFNKKL